MLRSTIFLLLLLLSSTICEADNCTSLDGLELKVRPEVLECRTGQPIKLELEIFNNSASEIRFEITTDSEFTFFETTDPSLDFTSWEVWSNASRAVVLKPKESEVFSRLELYEVYHTTRERKFKIGFLPRCDSREVIWSPDVTFKAKHRCAWCALHSKLGSPTEKKCLEVLRSQNFICRKQEYRRRKGLEAQSK